MTRAVFLFVVFLGLSQTGSAEDKTQVDKQRPVEPSKTEQVGDYEYRYFDLKPGQDFESQRGGVVRVTAITEERIDLCRPAFPHIHDDWYLPTEYCRSSMGNKEYLSTIKVDVQQQTVQIRLSTKVQFGFLDAFSF